ncbi:MULTISPECIES: M20 aminoacylase family protein [unclassified Paracoccus (in: a-proteobacteria)]|uniref:M20 aminoacylase family protein n=1 Tax=unclassified Paracoccus (in: a-proteobacteria) TaxID=2688777 RepID=UPI0016049ADA|nr:MULTISPECIES: M20 aminoacylase family protein [unclassified Paracoccus (in: a-proteobacteria)]MBB1492405.1 amidohydrolase [Paracoccus sp. MC1854]MBB1496766.1 amidohydrolase [Paracoccus sp. MC1862]QQO45402.1 amidohydrolase [Paracoccus sp. MC1862]
MPVKNRFAELHPEITAWRRDFHEKPELDYDVHRTAARVAELLRGFGADEVTEGVGRTGVVGVIRGRSDSSGRVIGLRADMDALPITEATGADYASKTPGVMHACGHDGHTAMLLGAAKYLAETRNFDGTAVVIFQPAEEAGGGGQAMVQDGLVDRWGIQEFYAMHNLPGLPAGQFAIRDGAMMAAADTFEILLTGKGGHAARPHDGVDTTLMAAQVIVALQSIVSRNVDPLHSAVVSVCVVETSSRAHNIIPQTVRLRGTARSLDPAIRDLVEERLHRVATGVAGAMGGSAEVNYQRGYPVTMNDPQATLHAAQVARQVAGEVDTEIMPMMAGEDFSYMLLERPGAYIFTGNGDTAMLHHPAYDFNDEAIPAGSSWYAGMIEARMPAA